VDEAMNARIAVAASSSTGQPSRPLPRVSVVMATYRRQDVLPCAIRSVIDQTMTDWELLVVDDEPSEATEGVIASFEDPRIRYLAHDRNRGLCAARNTGIRNATADYIAFLDDDDVFLARKLELQCQVLDRSADSVGVVSCFERIHRSGGNTVVRGIRLEGNVHRALLRNDLIRMQPLMVRRVCFERVGFFDERLRMHDDYDMTLRLSRSFRFTTINEPLVGISSTDASMSMNVENRIHAIETMMATHPEFREQRRVRARWERRLARHHAELGHRKEWRCHLLRALRADPTNIATWAALVVGTVLGSTAHLRLGKMRGRIAIAARAARAVR